MTGSVGREYVFNASAIAALTAISTPPTRGPRSISTFAIGILNSVSRSSAPEQRGDPRVGCMRERSYVLRSHMPLRAQSILVIICRVLHDAMRQLTHEV